jgi:hypothetical protein
MRSDEVQLDRMLRLEGMAAPRSRLTRCTAPSKVNTRGVDEQALVAPLIKKREVCVSSAESRRGTPVLQVPSYFCSFALRCTSPGQQTAAVVLG